MEDLVTFSRQTENRQSPITQAFDYGKLVRVRSRGIFRGPAKMLPEEGFYYWANYILQRCLNDFDSCVIFTGETGTGKSTLMMQMARTIDRLFDLRTDLCYTATALQDIYKQRSEHPGESRGRVVVFDEGVRGLLAGDQNTREQKETVKMLALVRALNVPLFIGVPDIWRLAKPVRENRAAVWIHVIRRGRAIVHVRRNRIQYNPDPNLGFDISEVCPQLLWDKFDDADPFWTTYMEVKMKRLNEYFHEKDRGRRGKPDPEEEEDDPTEQQVRDMLGEGKPWSYIMSHTGVSHRSMLRISKELKAERPRVESTSTAAEKPHRKPNAAGLNNHRRKQERNARVKALAEARERFKKSHGNPRSMRPRPA